MKRPISGLSLATCLLLFALSCGWAQTGTPTNPAPPPTTLRTPPQPIFTAPGFRPIQRSGQAGNFRPAPPATGSVPYYDPMQMIIQHPTGLPNTRPNVRQYGFGSVNNGTFNNGTVYNNNYNNYGGYSYGYGYIPGGTLNSDYYAQGNIVIPGHRRNNIVFPGYQSIYVPGQTCFAPFGVSYNCPPYISVSYAINAPYAYANGYETAVVQPYSETDDFAIADAERSRALRAALNDLTYFWEENDQRALRRHLGANLDIAVYQNERYAYALGSTSFIGLAQDAMDRVQTNGFRFTRIVRRNDGLVNAYAIHRYRTREEGERLTQRSATVRCTLLYSGGEWYLSAISLAPDSVAR